MSGIVIGILRDLRELNRTRGLKYILLLNIFEIMQTHKLFIKIIHKQSFVKNKINVVNKNLPIIISSFSVMSRMKYNFTN